MQHNEPFINLVNESKKQIKELSIAQSAELIKDHPDTIIFDVRETHEYEQGHLPNAIHLSKGVIELNIVNAVPDNTKTILLYCGSGSRSALAAHNVQKMGYRNVISMDGGFRGWVQAEMKVIF